MTSSHEGLAPQVRLRTLGEIERAGLWSLDRVITEYLQGGSGSELTVRRNRSAFDRIRFVPRVMSGLPHPSTATSLLGVDLRIPVMTAPFGSDGYFHPEGHRAVARANERFGICGVVPEAGTFSAEQLATAAPKGAAFGQLHPMGTEANFRSMVQRYVDAGYRGLVLTLDCPTPGWREHFLLNEFRVDKRVVSGNYPPDAEIDMEQALARLNPATQPAWTWDKLSELLADYPLPWLAKGILTAEDAVAALDAGAAGVIVSNHGGRQLDGVRSTIEALEPIAAAARGRGAIVLDSGIRRGSDVVKAVALGADAVLIGRLSAYGIAAAGEDGAYQVLELLRREIETVLILLGRGDITDLDRSSVEWES
ncbi:alpha-hydroxy acid oxidase [Pseudonocardia eucalypti]|uniref:Alpha-hydroxy acid oxidase n=1 Tax=Pseudonocardia eucalypti TaxID=648755 RepID=A0ABP9PS21_9PSEU|nr:4-hydroxymandelate oxidase [Pseudonocardia eucalypti]